MGLKSDFFQLIEKSKDHFLTQMTVVCPSGEGPGIFWGHFWLIFFRVAKMVQNGPKWPNMAKKGQKKNREKNVKKYFSKVGGMGPKALKFLISRRPSMPPNSATKCRHDPLSKTLL